MQDSEEKKTEIGYALKNKAESIVNLIDMFIRIEQGRITCSDEISDTVKGLIRDLCKEVFDELR